MTSSQWSSLLEGLIPLLYLATVALLVAILSHAQAVLVPLALAVMVTFVLTPLVKALERFRLPRIAAVGVAVLLTFGAVGAIGWVLTRQLNEFAAEMPRYSASIKQKVATLRAGRPGALTSVEKTVAEVSKELDRQEGASKRAADARAGRSEAARDVQQVVVVPSESTEVQWIRAVAPSVAPLATLGIVLLLAVFMLVQREDLRNRIIRLVGRGRVTLTTRTLDEAGQRISRFLLVQSAINGGFGALVAAGLFWIGVPYALLWGVVAALLRFIPYVGALLAMVMPTALAFVQFAGWGHTVETLGLFLALEAVTANLVEPVLIGHHTGVSSLALLVTALFWTWLWGPIGLVLSTPLTVCLAVLGKHVRQLEFLAVLLGDEEALEPDVIFYQRLLAHDEDEASEIVERQLESTSREQVFDDILVPALLLVGRDRARDEISDSDLQFVLQATGDIVQNVAEAQAKEDEGLLVRRADEDGKPRAHILGVPLRHQGDELALAMLDQLLDPISCDVHKLTTATLASEVVLAIERDKPDLVCITALPPGGLNHARYLCKRLRARFPELRVLVMRPGVRANADEVDRRLSAAGADAVVATLAEAGTSASQLLLPALLRSATREPAGDSVQAGGEPTRT